MNRLLWIGESSYITATKLPCKRRRSSSEEAKRDYDSGKGPHGDGKVACTDLHRSYDRYSSSFNTKTPSRIRQWNGYVGK